MIGAFILETVVYISASREVSPAVNYNGGFMKNVLILKQPFWIFENDLGIIGFIRFDLNLALLHFEISIVVDPKLRGKGFGRIILTHAVETCLARNPGFNLYAEAHIENLTSHLLFLKCGFQKCELKKDFLVFKRSANPN